MFCEIIFAGCVKYPIFNLPLQYRITKNRSRLLRTEPPAYLLRPGVHLFQRHLRRTITKSVYIAIISRLVGYFLNNARRIFPKRHIFVLRWVYPNANSNVMSIYLFTTRLNAWSIGINTFVLPSTYCTRSGNNNVSKCAFL